MEHTTFYQYRKPIRGVDRANVDDENYNWDRADAIEHSTQISLAPAYDSSETYNTGDVVMYEFLMYECIDDGVTGTWNLAKWTRTTAGEHGGGSDVEPNPTGEPTATLNKLGIEGTIYGIEGSGGGNVYGAFIDTNRVIQASTNIPANTDVSYTATEDCAVVWALIASQNGTYSVIVDGVDIASSWNQTGAKSNQDTIYLKTGQTITMRQSYGGADGSYTVYGLTFGTQNIFTPQIYSTEERCVGVWIDNKPLYQKTIEFTNVSKSGTVSFGIENVEMIRLVNGKASDSSPINYVHGSAPANNVGGLFNVSPSDAGWSFRCGADAPSTISGDITVLYTKTTDTAGRGSYNSLGVPMVHYSTDEQVVGTDEDGKTIYEKTFKVASPTWSSGSGFSWIVVDISSIGTVDKLIFVRGTVHDNTDNKMLNIPYFRVEDSESLSYECRVNSDGTPYFVLFVKHSSGAGYSLSNLSVTLQYTKSS